VLVGQPKVSVEAVLKVATILDLVLTLCLLLSAASQAIVCAQATGTTAARKWDEYGDINNEDVMARLDFFAIEVQKDPSAKAYVIGWGPEGEGRGSGRAILKTIREYLVETRGLADSRVETIYVGRKWPKNLPNIQLWIGKDTNPPPHIQETESRVGQFKGLFTEFGEWDDIDTGEAPGPDSVLANATYAGLAETLNQQKQSIPYLLGYNGKQAMPGAWRRVAEKRRESFKEFGVDISRIKIVYGGLSQETRSELWILPKGESPPVKDPGPEPVPKKAVFVASVSDEMWEGYERAALNRLLELVRENKALRVCLIVQLKTKTTDELETSIPTQAEVEENSKPLDLTELAEDWRKELVSKLKLSPDRFVLLVNEAPEYSRSGMEVWVVPDRAPLPSPDDTDGHETEVKPSEPARKSKVVKPLR